MCDWFNKKYLSWQLNSQGEGYEELKEQIENFDKPKSKLLEMINWGNPTETSLETTNVLTYELGDLVKTFSTQKFTQKKEIPYD